MKRSSRRLAMWIATALMLGGTVAEGQVMQKQVPPPDRRVPLAITKRFQQAIGQPNTSGVESLTLNPDAVFAGQSSAITVALVTPAPAAGKKVLLSAAPANLATLPPSVTVAAGQSTATFNVATATGSADATVTIEAWGDGATGKLSAPLKVVAAVAAVTVLDSIAVPAVIVSGAPSTGQVFVSDAAGAGAATVGLSSAGPTTLKVPATVVVPAGQRSATFTLTSASFDASGFVGVSASLNGVTKSRNVTVKSGADVTSISGVPYYLKVGGSVTVTPNFTGTAPAGGARAPVYVKYGTAEKVPVTVDIAAGKSSAPMTVTGKDTGQIRLFTNAQGPQGAAGFCEPMPTSPCINVVLPPTLATPTFQKCTTSLSNCPDVPNVLDGGEGLMLHVGISSPSADPVVVTISPSSSDVATISTTSVTLPVGGPSRYASPTVVTKPVTSPTSVTFTISCAVCQSPTSRTIVLNVNPGPNVSAISISTTDVKGGSTATGTVTLAKAAGTYGAKVDLTSSNASVCGVPASITVPAGQTVGSFPLSTKAVAATATVTIGASYRGGAAKTATVKVNP